MEDHDDPDGRSGGGQCGEKAEGPLGVGLRVHDEEVGGQVGQAGQGVDDQRLRLQVQSKRLDCWEDVVGGPIGEEQDAPHSRPRVARLLYPRAVLQVARNGRYRLPIRAFRIQTEDDVELSGVRVGGAEVRPASLVFVHGFFGSTRKRRLVGFIEEMARSFAVYAYDSRGHGASGGVCTYGDTEVFDVEAVSRLARGEGAGPVVTMGISMGGIAVLRHAALRGGVDCVVSVSTPAHYGVRDTSGVRRIRLVTERPIGRRIAGALGVRLTDTWSDPQGPADLVDRIAPTPLIVVHGRDDHYFGEEDAWELYRRAGEPKRLLLASRFGHAEDGLTPEFATLIAERIFGALGRSSGG